MKKDTTVKSHKLTKERAEFRKLIAANPSHFFDVKKTTAKLGGPPVGKTTYEELTCVGYQPQLKLLQATVQINLSTGFLGNPCSDGSTEYVQFYIDYGNGAGWEDVGYAAFNTHDIPNYLDCQDQPDKPLSYAVTLPLDPEKDCCNKPVLPKVRAILSWESLPTGPNDPVVWGNGLDRHIQIKPKGLCLNYLLANLQPELKIDLPVSLKYLESTQLDLPEPPELEMPQLVQLYADNGGKKKGQATPTIVEPHRFGLKHIHAATGSGIISPKFIQQKISEWQGLKLDWSNTLAELDKTSGNTSYEELDCLGLDPNTDRLVATYQIKRPAGYSGDLCAKGSTEFVAFWADWDDTCNWKYLGTTEVAAHDIATIPADGLHYTATLQANLADFLEQPCEEPKVGRLRAVLSWNIPPSTTNADDVPYWGNRIDTHVHIKPGEKTEGPHISVIGGIGVADINTLSSGKTLPGARFWLTGAFADHWLSTRDCPFGGKVLIQAPPILGNRYRVMARIVGSSSEQPVTDKIWTVDEYGSGTWRYADSDQAFTFLATTQNASQMVAHWKPEGDDLWEVRLQVIDGTASETGSSPWYRVQLDNTVPQAAVSLDSGPCEEFNPGVVITGRFLAREPSGNFGAFSLRTLPASLTPPPPNPATATPTTSETSASPGDTWSLNTSTMQPCGYVVHLRVWDRTVRNSVQNAHNSKAADVGFCLLAPEE